LTSKKVKFSKSHTCLKDLESSSIRFWRPSRCEIEIESSKVFDTIEEKNTEDIKIRNFISNTIRTHRNEHHEINIYIDWPKTIEDIEIIRKKEFMEKQKEEERIEMESKKKKRQEEENADLERTLRPKIMKKELGTHEEFMKNMRNEEFDEQVRSLWRKELVRKGEVLMSYPFIELGTMKSEMKNIETYISGVVPHVSSGDYREPFFGNMDRVFPQARHNILTSIRNETGSCWSYNYDTLESCVRLYHKVHRNPEGCSVESLKMYSFIFAVQNSKN
tara:strand:- start:529 stop:1356 length:828 start_codon:yes stop_codon:yes gene_type:complete